MICSTPRFTFRIIVGAAIPKHPKDLYISLLEGQFLVYAAAIIIQVIWVREQ